jgi:hypothetical protein
MQRRGMARRKGVAVGRHGFMTSAGTLAVLLACVMSAVTCSPALAAGACPNEAVRAESSLDPETHLPLSVQLPDCRAYELVSPPYTEGFAITEVGALSANGSQMIASSLGAFAGTESDPLTLGESIDGGPVYEFTRNGSGWAATPLDPNLARFPIQTFAGVSSDLTRTLWSTREPTESIYALDLELREPDGSMVKVGPMVPPSLTGPPTGYVGEETGGLEVVGRSRDLSRVLFTVGVNPPGALSFLWPGDTTSLVDGESLYEYAGTGNSSPALVGVNSQGALISDCETSLGGVGRASGTKYNAVSADGETVFFTAVGKSEAECASHSSVHAPAVDEVYARVGGSKTVAISEPSTAQCSSCRTSVKAPAEFEGASEDGSQVFFSTAQQLLPGSSGIYEYDFENPEGEKILPVSAGAPGHETSEPQVAGVVRVSEDGTHVYFVAGAKLTGANSEGREPAEGARNLYVFERDATYPQGRTVFVATLSGGDASDWHSNNGQRAQATPDGRFLVFASEAPSLTSDDTSTVRQIFEYDALQEKLVRVSAGQKAPGGSECRLTKRSEEGYSCDGNTDDPADEPELPASRVGLTAISNDGSYVFFASADALTPDALNNQVVTEYEARQIYAQSVYEYHSSVANDGGSIADGNVFLLSDGHDRTLHNIVASGVQLYGTDASGENVFFSSGDPLVVQDSDTQVSVYDARVDGGFPAPVSPVSCEGEACQGAPSSPVSLGSPASSSVVGGGNLAPPAGSTPAVRPKPLTRAQKLARALRGCSRKPKAKRAACKAQAEKKYGGKAEAGTSDKGRDDVHSR